MKNFFLDVKLFETGQGGFSCEDFFVFSHMCRRTKREAKAERVFSSPERGRVRLERFHLQWAAP